MLAKVKQNCILCVLAMTKQLDARRLAQSLSFSKDLQTFGDCNNSSKQVSTGMIEKPCQLLYDLFKQIFYLLSQTKLFESLNNCSSVYFITKSLKAFPYHTLNLKSREVKVPIFFELAE